MKKIFIYYSLNGSGDAVAKHLEEKGIKTIKVKPQKELPKSVFGQIMTGGFLASINYKAKLVDFDVDIDSYDEIIIGSPIWNSRLSTPINTVLEKLNFMDKKLTFILYSASGTSKKATEKINKLYSESTIVDLKEPRVNKEELKKLENI